MKTEKIEMKSAGRRVAALVTLTLALMLSFGIVGRSAASPKGRASVAAESARKAEASAATASSNDVPEQRLAGHSEIQLQLD
jgi:hypothetical protein